MTTLRHHPHYIRYGHIQAVTTNIPSRLDRLPWSRWHWLVVISLGIIWTLDGLEVTIAGAMTSALTSSQTLHLTTAEVGLASGLYLVGAVLGALLFGRPTDRLGRKKLFMTTLSVYIIATIATAFSFTFAWFAMCRFLTGCGIGGEYAAINSAIDELIPARVRGWIDLAINSTWWAGTALGAGVMVFLLNPSYLPADLGWRLTFSVGVILALVAMVMRRHVPESPRWLMMHGRFEEAERVVSKIERQIMRQHSLASLPEPEGQITLRPIGTVSFLHIAETMFKYYLQRSLLSFSLMVSQTFLYNAVFFTYSLILTAFYHIPINNVAWYLIPFALGNLIGPLTIGHLFDTIGRRKMISFTYIVPGLLLIFTGWLFVQGYLNAVTQTLSWSLIFFLASAGASSAYLTISEIFPLETRAVAIAFFYALGTALGGAFAPILFSLLIQTNQALSVFYGDVVGAAFMMGAGVIALFWAVDAENEPLEKIAPPLEALFEEERGLSLDMAHELEILEREAEQELE